MSPLSFLFGTVVGLALGLTGGGGAIIAVPLLVYGLHVPAKEAVIISLISVGITSLLGFLHRYHLRQVDYKSGLIFAIAGMIGAPIGSWLANFLSDIVLMVMFACLMLIVAIRMWQQASQQKPVHKILADREEVAADTNSCQRDLQGRLNLNTRCALLLLAVGILIGIQTGLFGVGGGFLIVPALILFSGISIQHAVGTSLMVIFMISCSGVVTQLSSGRSVSLDITTLFLIGSVSGLFIGQRFGRNMAPAKLQKLFALAIVFLATFILIQNFVFRSSKNINGTKNEMKKSSITYHVDAGVLSVFEDKTFIQNNCAHLSKISQNTPIELVNIQYST